MEKETLHLILVWFAVLNAQGMVGKGRFLKQ